MLKECSKKRNPPYSQLPTTKSKKLFFVFAFSLIFLIGVVSAATINVPTDYSTIQSAINAASAGDTISVAAGTYTEDLVINKSITLQGANKATTIIKGIANVLVASWPLGVPNIDIQANGVKIHGFTIQGPDYVAGRYASGMMINGQNIEIYDNNFAPTKVDAADELGQAIITYSKTAIPTADVSGLNIHDNTITGSGIVGCEGIYINPHTGTGTIIIKNNQISGVNIGITVEAGKTTVSNNTVNTNVNKESGPYGTYGIRFFDSTYAATLNDILISNNNVQNFKRGIRVGNGGTGTSSITATVQANTLINNSVGIWARQYGVASLTASSNSLAENTKGVQNDGIIEVKSEKNWWGTTLKSTIQSLISGSVDYDPWCTDSTCATNGTTRCSSNTDCDDGNANTQDICNNPGTITSSCTNGAIACKINSDCGTNGFIGGTVCADRDVWANYKTYTCSNPGTSTSSCSSSEVLQLKQSCAPNYCLGGSCSVKCKADLDCDDGNDYTRDTCIDAGMASASCTYTTIKCISNSDCSDGNDYTDDVCNNPGTITSSCTNGAIACKINSDCGTDTFSGENYCYGQFPNLNVNRDYITYTCSNPGTSASKCSSIKAPVLITECAFKCENAKCISNSAPKITSTAIATAKEGTLYTYQVVATDADNDKLWYSDNSPLFNINSLTGLISFTPAKANVGTHAITITITDSLESVTQTYTLSIEGVNNPPVLNAIGALTAKEGNLFQKTITAIDAEGNALTFSDDTSLFDINPITGLISFTPTKTDVGTYTVTINVNDGTSTSSEKITLTVLAKEIANTAPSITSYSPLEDVSITELEEAKFTITAVDRESTPSILWLLDNQLAGSGSDEYTFVGDNSMEGSNAGIHTIKAEVSDGELKVQKTWTLTVTRVKDTDGDGIADENDNCIFVQNVNQLDSDLNKIGDACQGNIDGDVVPDEEDFVSGTSDAIDSNVQLNLNIGGDENLNRVITGTLPVSFTTTTINQETQQITKEPVVSFNFDFTSTSKLDLSQVEIKKQEETADAGEVIVKGINLPSGQTKTVYMDRKAGTDTVCIKDAEISSVKEVSLACTGTDEYLITCDGIKQRDYTCTIEGDKYKVEGMSHSGLIESKPNNKPNSVITTSSQEVSVGNTIELSGYGTDADGDSITDYEWDLSDYDDKAQKIIFVTKDTYDGDLNGLAGADSICQSEADAKGLLGTYKVWLSDSKTNANERLAIYDNYKLIDGTIIKSNELLTYNPPGYFEGSSISLLQNPINKDIDENIVNGFVWTSTNTKGITSSKTCDDWSSSTGYGEIGDNQYKTNAWTINTYKHCSEKLHLYCLQQMDIEDGGITQQQSPSVKLTKLGTYTFKFKVKDERGLWSDKASLTITVKDETPAESVEKEEVWYNFLGTGLRELSTDSWNKATCNPTDCIYNKQCYPKGTWYPGRIGTDGKSDTFCASNYNNEQGVWITCRSNIDKVKIDNQYCIWGGMWADRIPCSPEYGYTEGC